ncbi:MAG TPA: hypothetical protein VHC18_01100, partial [Amycolatopsis sp.]|nr:hypothetical protein [Amycolatopsis sp.]
MPPDHGRGHRTFSESPLLRRLSRLLRGLAVRTGLAVAARLTVRAGLTRLTRLREPAADGVGATGRTVRTRLARLPE